MTDPAADAAIDGTVDGTLDAYVDTAVDASGSATGERAGVGGAIVDWWSSVTADRWRLARVVAFLVYGAFGFWQYFRGMPWSSRGLPLEREQLLGWMAVGAALWSIGRQRAEVLLAIGGFGALAACFVLYDYSRGAIDNLWGNQAQIPQSNVTAPSQAVLNARRIVTAERALFFGTLPTEWLQDRLYLPSNQRPPKWEVVTALVYVSHFLTVYVIALFMWFRNKRKWLQWVRSLVTLITLGVMGYLLCPTAPPWMAAKFNIMEITARPGTRALRYIHLQFADRLWNKGQGMVNLVAAMPSLHQAFTVLVLAFFWRTARPWLRVILVAYPVLMLFTLVYGGEHYIMDCLVGALLAWLAVWLNRWFDGWRVRRAEARRATEAMSDGPEGPAEEPAYSSV